MFAPACQGKGVFFRRSIHSADLADLDGWLIGGQTVEFKFELYCLWFRGQRVAVSQLNHAINDVPSHKSH